ncbi:MAG: hypothetical protein ABFD10_16145, partial [Prolixibacteraceae bacterium]
LLNFAYLNLWVNHQPVELHFAVRTQADEDTLYPVFVEDSNVRIKKAFYGKNNKQTPLKTVGSQGILLPSSKDLRITAVLENIN